MKAKILNEDFRQIGQVDLAEEELVHFSSTGSVPARIALDSDQIRALGIDEDDFIFVREAS